MLPDLDLLRDADADQAARFFADVHAEDLVAAVAATSDADLLELIGREEIRPAAVEGILTRLHEFSIPERVATLRGVVLIELGRRSTVLERHALVFRDGTMSTRRDVAEGEPADVVLRTSLLRFVRLVSGERNAGLEYLSGKLDIEGDSALALGVGGIFKVPGTGSVAVDPTALDPVEVATALKGVPNDHLAKVMRSGFRPIVLGEIFRRFPDFLNPRKAGNVELTVAFRLTGSESGEVDRYVVRIDHGTATVTEGGEGIDRDATITCAGHDFLRLVIGQLSPITGVLRGQLNVKGDKAKALQLSSVMDIPQPR